MSNTPRTAGESDEKYEYSVGSDDHETRGPFPSDQKLYGHNWDFVIEELAAHHDNDTAGEEDWPLDFRIYMDGQEVANYTVDREWEPVFYVV